MSKSYDLLIFLPAQISGLLTNFFVLFLTVYSNPIKQGYAKYFLANTAFANFGFCAVTCCVGILASFYEASDPDSHVPIPITICSLLKMFSNIFAMAVMLSYMPLISYRHGEIVKNKKYSKKECGCV